MLAQSSAKKVEQTVDGEKHPPTQQESDDSAEAVELKDGYAGKWQKHREPEAVVKSCCIFYEIAFYNGVATYWQQAERLYLLRRRLLEHVPDEEINRRQYNHSAVQHVIRLHSRKTFGKNSGQHNKSYYKKVDDVKRKSEQYEE